MNKERVECVKPVRGIISSEEDKENNAKKTKEREVRMLAQIGKPAPDFEANAFVNGSFKSIKLSDYKGKWVVLCFYPGDFTFV
ncbi:MAG: redoxin domain-containing protein [Thermodesulfobacterium sp.]|nr:redoxin domain-containing protein [Thermodesulfobacterium sp.]